MIQKKLPNDRGVKTQTERKVHSISSLVRLPYEETLIGHGLLHVQTLLSLFACLIDVNNLNKPVYTHTKDGRVT